jgi:transposase-like protein
VLGVVGRESGKVRLEVVEHSTREELQPRVLAATAPGATVNTDEWKAYGRLPEHGRAHATVCHNPAREGGPEYARDDDGDGVREVHCNTMEGTWTGLRNFLRTFRGVSKKYLGQYAAIFEWTCNVKAATTDFLRAMLGLNPSTYRGT